MPEEEISILNPQEEPTLPDEGGETGGAVEDVGGEEDQINPPDDLTVKTTALEKEIADLQRRVSGQTKSWQEERARAEKAEAELTKYNKYKEVIDFSELDEMVGGDDKPTPQKKIDAPALDPVMQNRINMLELRLLESDYANNNPDKAFIFKDKDLKEKVEASTFRFVQEELNEYGRVISKPDEILGKAVDSAVSFVNRIKADGARSEVEKRQKIETSGADLGGGGKPLKTSEDEEDKPLTQSDYVSIQRKTFDITKTIIPPDKPK